MKNSNLDTTKKLKFSELDSGSDAKEIHSVSESDEMDYDVEVEFIPQIPSPR